MSMIHPHSSIPELIKCIRYSFRQSEFDEVQGILIERENVIKNENENLVKDRDSLKKDFDLLRKDTTRLTEKIRILTNEKLGIEKKLEKSRTGYEEMVGKISEMEKENEELKNVKLDANRTIEELKRNAIVTDRTVQELKLRTVEADRTIFELKAKMTEELKRKEVETDRIVHELKLKHVEANQTIDKLKAEMMEELKRKEMETDRVVEELKFKNAEANQSVEELKEKMMEELKRKEMETDRVVEELKLKNAEANHTIDDLKAKMESEISVTDLDPRILMKLAKIMGVSVDDLQYLVDTDDSAAETNANAGAGNRVVVPAEFRPTSCNSAGNGGIRLTKKGSNGFDGAENVVVISDSDDERGSVTYTNKRSRLESAGARKKAARSSYSRAGDFQTPPLRFEVMDSDDESCSTHQINSLVHTLQSKTRRWK